MRSLRGLTCRPRPRQLPLTDLVPLSVSCRTIRNLSSTSLSPFTSVVDSAIEEAFVPRASEEDPEATSSTSTRHLLATLGTYSHIHSRALLPLLIRAPLRPILDECQLPRLLAREWKEAFEARFLPSWKRIKQEGESWRACFLRWAAGARSGRGQELSFAHWKNRTTPPASAEWLLARGNVDCEVSRQGTPTAPSLTMPPTAIPHAESQRQRLA